MGGPDSLDAVEPFLRNLFSDRDIIKIGPKLLQPLIARLPAGYRIEQAGSIEESGKATTAMLPLFPIMIALTLLTIILQVRSIAASGNCSRFTVEPVSNGAMRRPLSSTRV